MNDHRASPARRSLAALAVAAALIASAGCGATAHGAASPQPLALTGGHARLGKLTITGAYIPDPASPSMAAAYFTVANAGPADRLVAVRSPAFRSSSLHRYTTTSGGAEEMIPATNAVVPAGGRLVLKPGSYHVMLMNPPHALKRGQTATLTLVFANAGSVQLRVPVVADTGLAGQPGSNSMPGMKM